MQALFLVMLSHHGVTGLIAVVPVVQCLLLLDLIAQGEYTVEALATERGGDERIWGSMVKQAMKRVRPGFNESFYGFRSFNGMLEEAERRGSLVLERDEKSGQHIIRLPAED